jgi:hypothetical protein
VKPKSWSCRRSRRSTPAVLLTPPGTTTTPSNVHYCLAISSPHSACRRPLRFPRASSIQTRALPAQAPVRACPAPLPFTSPEVPLHLNWGPKVASRWIRSTKSPKRAITPARPHSAV